MVMHVNANDRVIFDKPLEERLTMRTLTLKNWVKTYTPALIQAICEAKEQQKTGHQDTRTYFRRNIKSNIERQQQTIPTTTTKKKTTTTTTTTKTTTNANKKTRLARAIGLFARIRQRLSIRSNKKNTTETSSRPMMVANQQDQTTPQIIAGERPPTEPPD